MQDLSRRACEKFRDARRALGLTQTALAEEIGFRQEALSMFEKGNPTKLSAEYVEKLAKRLGVDLKDIKESAAAEERESGGDSAVENGFCPERECPSNTPYSVCGRTFYRITLQRGRYCAHCGEVMETRCRKCGKPVNEGACCTTCGTPYIA